ncbi:tail fiber protein [Flagellimonas nanhaiensis]|uniref:Peptidase S74 domain-containing protein n=1 Tax=Flagellimonas nanhaiensis TaxID=2292706 RepID=A0A371JUJ4_9FLAO|nr:tail fiber protein [Allomuricauda nanhaiensis]RDY61493.1 hypothetical protein DX873_04845 [Allomuricauda nanhaiensis]
MKNIIYFTLFSLFSISLSFAQWTDNGTHITTTDNVGIGTTNPIAPLSVKSNSSSSSNSGFILEANNSGNALAKIAEKSTNGARFHMYEEGVEKVAFYTDGTNNHISAGNLGIGTSEPKEKFHLEGNMLIDSYNLGDDNGIFFRENFSSANKYNLSILLYDHSNSGASPDGLSLNAYDGISFSTGSNNRNERMRITQSGNVGIGTTNPDMKLTVKGKIHAEEVKIDLNVPAPDYVFDNDYDLITLEQVENFIAKNNHLPEIPSAKEFEENGILQAEMDMKLLKKIEELTLYTLQQQKEIEELKTLVERLLESKK